jgi:predicted protein tyrosine phosphatase
MSGHVHMIIPRIYLGDYVIAADKEWLKNNNIHAVFNCTKNLPFAEVEAVRHYRIPVDDSLKEEDLKKMGLMSFEIVYKMLQEYNNGANILVHCHAGRQRSAAAVAMFLIFLTRKSIDETIAFIRSRRRVAFTPMPNFYKSIRFYDSILKS